VHLNGPPGIGKSTLARRYVHDRPLSFCLDLDGLRSLIGRWDEHEQESGLLARRMALRMAATHLGSGHDVVVPQLVALPSFVTELAHVAAECEADFHHVVLLDAGDAAEARFLARASDAVWGEHHRDAARMIRAAGGFSAVQDQLLAALPHLPRAVVLRTTAGDVAGSYAALVSLLDGLSP
jgi:predicted kinase